MNHRQNHLDDRGHALALAAIAVLALALGATAFVDAAVLPTRAELRAVYSDEVAAGVLLYRLPELNDDVDRHVVPDAPVTSCAVRANHDPLAA